MGSVVSLAWRHRPLFSLSLLGTRYIVVGTPALCRELCDESRFHKFVALGLERLRPVTGDGLFTAFHGSEAWGVAHRLLLPLFGTFRIRDMFDDMRDVAEQLTLKWYVAPRRGTWGPGGPGGPGVSFARALSRTSCLVESARGYLHANIPM